MTFDEAARLAAYVRGQCWWLDVYTHQDGSIGPWRITLHLLWPKGMAETVREYRRSLVNRAMDRLNDASDRYWSTVPCSR